MKIETISLQQVSTGIHITGVIVHSNRPPPEQMLISGFCMRKRAVVSTVAAVHPSKPLESCLFGFSCSGGGAVWVDCGALHY